MPTQSEKVLEDNLIAQLQTLGYEKVVIKDEEALLTNLKVQLEKHNGITLSKSEFERILNHLSKGNIFGKAQTLRQRFTLEKDDGEYAYISFMNLRHWCQNEYQVTHQITMKGNYKNRYDVTLLVNGLPLVQIELKRRGLEIKEAFNQTNRYQRHTFGASRGLFQYIQLFVISNGVNTKYYANNPVGKQEFKQTFYWTDVNNKKTSKLEHFAAAFLEKCHVSKMIAKYIVLNQTHKMLMVLRPYQYFAVEAIVDRVRNSNKNGYVWHTTGSGKTLTSFKASQILMDIPEVEKVVFVVDRRDLDYQTAKEFNSFKKDSVDSTDNTATLVSQLTDDTRLIVTTIQKLNTAIKGKRYVKHLEHLRDKRLVFIFDECHRSQFGDTHQNIKNFFTNNQMFGFTGTPIFAKNAISFQGRKHTTAELFDSQLHQYVITDAIKDENVLKFSVEYVGRYKQKEGSTEIDIEVEAIDTRELMESQDRLEKITDYVLAHHDRKTHSRVFTGMFCVSNVDMLIRYYEAFKERKEAGKHNLKIAAIFSYQANEADRDATGYIGDETVDDSKPVNKHSRAKLDEFMQDYNAMFNTNYNTKDSKLFSNYQKDIGKRVKSKEIDILLVVNMFLTGYDSKSLNTLFVDKNLKYHGLIQAYSRTNRILGEKKSQGNIVCFRNLKKNTDDAIALFADKQAKEVIIMEPYEVYVGKFNEALSKLRSIAAEVEDVDDLLTEDDEFEFVKAFRNLIRIKNVLSSFSDFSFDDIEISEQEFEDFKSKYLDIHHKVKSDRAKEKVSILDDVDFELELIHRDKINVTYIISLLAKLKGLKEEERKKKQQELIDMLSGEVQLRSKKELIEKFILENLPQIKDIETIPEEFESFWDTEKQFAFQALAQEEKLEKEGLEDIIGQYLFTGREPLKDDVIQILQEKPSFLKMRTTVERVVDKIKGFIDTFIEGMA